jgi:hypothetical protein
MIQSHKNLSQERRDDMTQGEQLIGIAIGWQPSRVNDSGKTVPSKLELAIDGESNAELAFFQNHMQFLSGKDGSSFLDKQVSIHAIYKSFYEPTNMRQFTPAGTLRVIGDQQAVAPTQPVRQATQATPTQAPRAIDGAEVGNSKTNVSNFIGTYLTLYKEWPSEDDVERFALLVNTGSRAMVSNQRSEKNPEAESQSGATLNEEDLGLF